MPILHKCSWRGCSSILEEQGYCDRHKPKIEAYNKEVNSKRHTIYSTNRKLDKEQKKYQDFYLTKGWKDCRTNAIRNTVGVDVLEFYRTGKMVQGYTVHHIIELCDSYDMRLDVDNLIYLTQSNHIRVHQEYLKGKKEKRLMQELLMSLKCKFIDEFGL